MAALLVSCMTTLTHLSSLGAAAGRPRSRRLENRTSYLPVQHAAAFLGGSGLTNGVHSVTAVHKVSFVHVDGQLEHR